MSLHSPTQEAVRGGQPPRTRSLIRIGVVRAGVLPCLRVEPSRNRPPEKARELLTFSTIGRRREFATCASYSDWEQNPDFGRLNLDHSSGILNDSVSSDGLQKSDGNREREGEESCPAAEAGSEVLNPSDACATAESPERRYGCQNGRQHATERRSRERRVGVSTTDEWWRKRSWHRNPLRFGRDRGMSGSRRWGGVVRKRTLIETSPAVRRGLYSRLVEETTLICEHSFSVDEVPLSGMGAVS